MCLLFCAGKSLESVLARLNRFRPTKGDAAELAGLRQCCLQYFFMHYICECQGVSCCYYCWLLWHIQVSSRLHYTGLIILPWWEQPLCGKYQVFTRLILLQDFYSKYSVFLSSRSVGWWCSEVTMESTGSAATEADSLKRGEDGVETGTAPSATELKKKSCKEGLGFSKLTHWRTAVFFFSLFLCLTIVFAFSFIIPCPVRPQYLISWNRTFPEASAYNHMLSIALLHSLLLCCKSPVSSPSFHRLLICRFPSQLSPLPPRSNLWLYSYWRCKQG